MKKARLTELVRGMVFSVAIIFLFSGEIHARQVRPHTRTYGEAHKIIKKQSRKKANKVSAATFYKQAYRKLGKTINLSALTPETPFSEAIDILRNSTEPPLKIIVLWRDLSENADIDRDTPVGMEAVSGISLGKNLELLLMSVSAGGPAKLGYVVEKGVIIIATKDSVPRTMITRIYDVTHLLSTPANYFYPPMGFGGMGYGRMPYGGYGGGFYGYRRPRFYGGYGRTYGGYGGGYGMGMPYGGYYGYSPFVGRVSTGTSLSVSPNMRGPYIYNR